jgi:hypothetical protein
VEVIQNIASLPTGIRESTGNNSTMGSDQQYSITTDQNRGERAYANLFKESIKSSKLILSTPIPVQRNGEGDYEWWRFFQLNFDLESIEKERSITVNLFRTKKNKDNWEQLGRSNSFYIVHLSGQEMKEIVLDFKDDYDSKSEGKIKLRLQYVLDERLLFRDLIKAFEEHKALIEIWIDILEEQREKYMQITNKEIKSVHEASVTSQNAGFYSMCEESDLAQTPRVSHDYIDNNEFIDSPRSYDVTSEFIFGKKEEEYF